jgi:hypothetical protein
MKAFRDRRRFIVARRAGDENILRSTRREEGSERAQRGDRNDVATGRDKHSFGTPRNLTRRIEDDYLQRRLLPKVTIER